ncbi:MAG TPA: VWA domain-containing protein, partial [Armatimonadetes bacterium]|nr:VWA domain-containing protein [Armatimonadota bacterium]
MHFLAPSFFALLSLATIILLLYMLKLRRKEVIVPSTLLWEQVIRDVQANAPFQRLRYSLLLLIQLLILTFIITALARPYLSAAATRSDFIAVILDASASMQATDVHPSRFQVAKGIVQKLIRDLSFGDQMMIVQATHKPRVLIAFTSDKGALRSALANATPSDTTTNLKDALLLVMPLITQRKRGEIVIVSDGATERLRSIIAKDIPIRFIRIGRRCDNIGIVAMSVRRGMVNRQLVQVFVGVHNFSDRRKNVTLELYARDYGGAEERGGSAYGRLIAVREMEVPAHKTTAQVFDELEISQGILTAKIDARDDLAVDNVAHAYLTPLRRLKVLLVTQGNAYLERALEVQRGIDAFVTTPEDYNDAERYDVSVFDGFAPPRLPQGGVLLINAICPEVPIELVGTIPITTFMDWDRDHDVTKYVNFTDVSVTNALKIKLQQWDHPIAMGEDNPLIIAGMVRQRRILFFAFDIQRSNLPGRVAFPILMTAAVHWLGQSAQGVEAEQARTGSVVTFTVPSRVGRVNIAKPDGQRVTVNATNRAVYFDQTDKVGIYKASARNFKHEFAVSLLSKDESNIAPREQI